MVSSLAWLDSSHDDQKRMRELLRLFSDQESRDELGIGQLRDAIGDRLFPGTSTLHTRARYLVIVPWCYEAAARRAAQSRKATGNAAALDKVEREVISTLKRAGAGDGLIGRVADIAVKTLPSAIYATSLERYGIRVGNRRDTITARVVRSHETEELAERDTGTWHPTLPRVPLGFPYELPDGLDMTFAEAGWLRDRVLASAPGTLLAHLLGDGADLTRRDNPPWADVDVITVPDEIADDLRNAASFSVSMHGAALLYNLLVAERYESSGFTSVEAPVDDYRDRLAAWADDAAYYAAEVARWHVAGFLRRASDVNPRIRGNAPMQTFVKAWLGAVADGRAERAADDSELRELVCFRERQVKRAQSRLTNDKLLRAWAGASGSGRLNFRWPNVRRMANDIHDGLGRKDDDVAA